MEKTPALTVENFIDNWNIDFPNYPLTPPDLKKSHTVMGALFHVFDRLGIDKEAVLQAPSEDETNKHVMYYRDLVPVINMTRIINHLVSVMPQVGANISIIHFLQPTATTSHSILLLLYNLMVFNEERLRDIAPYEEELFSKSDEVKTLENRKNRLLEMLNEQAEEKGKRAETMEKLETEINKFYEELKQEKEAHEKEKQELDMILNENKQAEILLKQKKAHRDGLVAEVEKKRSQRVYDADDIKAQAEQAAQNVREAEEKLNSLRATLMQKENSLKNLHALKPNLDTANNLLHEIMKLSEGMKDDDSDDLELDSKDGELEVFNMELNELEAQLGELRAAREEAAKKRQESQARREQERMQEKMKLADAEEKERKNQERAKKAAQRILEIKQLTVKYEEEKAQGMQELPRIKDTFTNELNSIEEALINKALEAKKRIEETLRSRNNR
ncbi:unnamed protein product, partial [Iphiclides podalirius]